METLQRVRSLLIGSALILMGIGVVMIYSASAIYAFDQMKDSTYFLKRHLVYLALGGILLWVASRVNIQALRRHTKAILIWGIVLVVLVLLPFVGHSAGGARRWFKILGLSFQPSEYLKLAVIFYMADFLDRRKETISDLKHTVFPAIVVLGLCAGLVFLQPDLGTAVTIALVTLILFFTAGFNIKHLLSMIICGIPVLLYAMLAKPYRRKRILAFVNPWEDPRGVGYQVIQSFLAIGSGGIFGVGLGRSQQKLFFLPESHTDFIFSIIAEELGFLGTSSIVILFAVFIFSGMVIVFRAKSHFSQLLGMGLVSLIGLQAVINIGVSTGALPTKGLSLPFISYGGSALLTNMTALGLLINLSRELPEDS